MNFKLESFQNPYLSAGTNRVDAILTVTTEADGAGGANAPTGGVVGFILDTSGSMQGERIDSVIHATRQAIQLLDEQTWFFIVGFADNAGLIFNLAQATPANKALADAQIKRILAGGTTRMSAGLLLARQQFAHAPNAIHYVLFLTDGKNNANDETDLDAALNQCEGVFQCDCRGVGTDWQVKQLQKIAHKLLGSAQIIAAPSGLAADFSAAIQNALSRAVNNVRLRLWTPKSARILSVKQMSPDIITLTDRKAPVDAQSADYPTGAWAAESRDYYVAIEMLTPGDVGDEMLACRPSLVYEAGGQTQEVKAPQARVLASWTDDEALSARINVQVAHYTGQEELAEAIQQGLEARAQGDADTATRMLGRAAKLAQESNNEETTTRLKKVVDIVDAEHGTVRLNPEWKSRRDGFGFGQHAHRPRPPPRIIIHHRATETQRTHREGRRSDIEAPCAKLLLYVFFCISSVFSL